jgi:uncharacterized protein (DUF924 family)
MRNFYYFPFMHSEELADQTQSLAFFRGAGDQHYIQRAEAYFEMIRNFGRFPFRNEILGRASKPEETAFLADNEAIRALC